MLPQIEDGWEKWWVKSDWKKDEKMLGEWHHTSGNWSGDANDKGIFFFYTLKSLTDSAL